MQFAKDCQGERGLCIFYHTFLFSKSFNILKGSTCLKSSPLLILNRPESDMMDKCRGQTKTEAHTNHSAIGKLHSAVTCVFSC